MRLGFAAACRALASSVLGCSLTEIGVGTEAPGVSASPGEVSVGVSPTTRIQPQDIVYLSAFRLPPGGDRPATFAYGGGRR